MNIIIPVEQFQKLRLYVEGVPGEISGFGKVRKEKDTLFVEEIRIFSQSVSGGDAKLDYKSLGKFWDELMKNNEEPADWKLWWHSHANMDAYFSNIDEATIEDYDTQQQVDNWLLSLVTNKLGKTMTRLDVFQPIRCTIENLPVDIRFNNPAVKEQIKKEIKEKVTQVSYIPKRRKVSVYPPYSPPYSVGSAVPRFPLLGEIPMDPEDFPPID